MNRRVCKVDNFKVNVVVFTLLCVFIGSCQIAAAPQEGSKSVDKPDNVIHTECSSEKYADLIGADYDLVSDQIAHHRHIRPGYKYTQQYISERLNIVTNEKGQITAVKCG
jgi:hypothetical protein